MDAAAIRTRLEKVVHPYPVPEWELESHAEEIAGLPETASGASSTSCPRSGRSATR